MTPERQVEILSRNTEEVLPHGELLERLRRAGIERRPLRVKQGFDPTAPDIHLGHTVGLRKLREFQDLGHQVVLIVGDYTAMVGDPSGRSKTRPRLSQQEVDEHAATYLEQFFRVLERDPAPPRLPVEIHRNGEWFAGMSFMDILRLTSQYTVSQLLERDDFGKRFAAEQPIGVHELLYPLMQGYDSVAIRADVELGATEQKFNLLMGRELQRLSDQPSQIIMTLPVLPGLDGVQRMSKSLGNYIGVADPPGEMFGKVMRLPDHVMESFWRLVTDASEDEIEAVRRDLDDSSVNPMGVKKKLGERIVTLYHGTAAAARAREDFEAQFSRREAPDNLEVFGADESSGFTGKPTIVNFAMASGLCESRSEVRRLLDAGAVEVDGERIHGIETLVRPDRGHVLRIGRRMKRYVPAGQSGQVK